MADLSPGASYGGILGMDSALVGSAGNPALSMISGDWLGLGVQVLGGALFGSKVKQSGAGSASDGLLNTTGWATGDSSAEGADLSSTQSIANMNNWPWWYWAAGTLIAVAVIKKAV